MSCFKPSKRNFSTVWKLLLWKTTGWIPGIQWSFNSPQYGESEMKQTWPFFTFHNSHVKYLDLFSEIRKFFICLFFDSYFSRRLVVALWPSSAHSKFRNIGKREEPESPIAHRSVFQFFLQWSVFSYWKQPQSIKPLNNWLAISRYPG